MIHALRALRNNSDLLMCTMDVFIKEPSLDWKVLCVQNQPCSGKIIGQKKVHLAPHFKCLYNRFARTPPKLLNHDFPRLKLIIKDHNHCTTIIIHVY